MQLALAARFRSTFTRIYQQADDPVFDTSTHAPKFAVDCEITRRSRGSRRCQIVIEDFFLEFLTRRHLLKRVVRGRLEADNSETC